MGLGLLGLLAIGSEGIQSYKQDRMNEQMAALNQGVLGEGVNLADPNVHSQYAQGLMQIPGARQAGLNLIGNVFQQQQAQAQQAAKPLWSPQQILQATTAQYTAAQKAVSDTRNRLQYFDDATQTVARAGNFRSMKGADDLAFVNSFSKMLRPNEAVMSEDVQNVLRTLGYGDMINQLLGAVEGKSLTETQRRELYNTMQTLGQKAQQQNADQRAMISQRLQGTPIDPANVLQPQVPFSPFEGQSQSPTGEITRGIKTAPFTGPLGPIDPMQPETFSAYAGKGPFWGSDNKRYRVTEDGKLQVEQ